MSASEDYFEVIPIGPQDWAGMSPSEAYCCGIELGCFMQACAISRNCGETIKIRLPSERYIKAKEYLESVGEEGKFFWLNDDVMLVVIER